MRLPELTAKSQAFSLLHQILYALRCFYLQPYSLLDVHLLRVSQSILPQALHRL